MNNYCKLVESCFFLNKPDNFIHWIGGHELVVWRFARWVVGEQKNLSKWTREVKRYKDRLSLERDLVMVKK